nr:glycosyl hydrolase [Candidatus Sigynarchaeota archaeon]
MASFLDNLTDPPKIYRPMVRWWWPGMDVERDELVKEIQELDENGFGGAEIQSFLIGSPSPNEELKHRFAPHPFYYEMVAAVLAEATKRALTIDLTISSSWPPGGSWVPRADSLHTLLMGTAIVHGGSHIEMKAPPIQLNPFYKSHLARMLTGNQCRGFNIDDFKPVTTVAVKSRKPSASLNFIKPKAKPLDIATCVDITPKGSDPCWISRDFPAGTWQVFSIYGGPSGMSPLSDAKPSPDAESLVVDMFNEGALQRFFHGQFDPAMELWRPYLGKTLRALFTDSQEIAAEWHFTTDFFDEFKKRRGYDVRPYLPVCYVPNRDNQFTYVAFMNEKPCFEFLGGEGERIRHDWEETLSDLFAERYCNGISRMAREIGMQHRVQPYGIRVDLLKANGHADIPETEQLFAGGLLDFLKIAGDAALIYNKPIASCETLTAMQRDYMTTPFKIKVAVDKLFVAGINQAIYHGYPYFAPWKNYPGHYPWSPPCHAENLNRNNPFAPFFAQINGYVTRGQYLLRQGTTKCNVGVYYPHWNYDHKMLKKEDFGGGYLEGFDGEPPKGAIIWFLTRVSNRIDKMTLPYQQLGDQLMSRGYFYAHVNEEALLAGTMVDHVLHVGGARLEVLILPGIDKISLPLSQKLAECSRQGLKVIFWGAVPDGQPGFHDHEKNDLKITAIVNSVDNDFLILDRGKDLSIYLWSELQILPCIEFVKPDRDVQCICKETPEGNLYFIRSTSKEPSKHSIRFRESGKIPHLIDLWTGSVEPVVKYEAATGRKAMVSLTSSTDKDMVEVDLASYGSCMIWFANQPPSELVVHVIEADLEVARNGRVFSGFAAQAGIYKVKLSNGQERVLKVAEPAPHGILLAHWRLTVHHRETTGETRIIEIPRVNLGDWRKIKQLKYSSGPGTYTTTFSTDWTHLAKNVRLVLKLGKVHDVAVVKVNGKEAKPLLVPPYETDITGLVLDGQNTLEITVHGTLRNLLVGYGKKRGKKGKPWRHHKHHSLMPVGLFGPASIEMSRRIDFEP